MQLGQVLVEAWRLALVQEEVEGLGQGTGCGTGYIWEVAEKQVLGTREYSPG